MEARAGCQDRSQPATARPPKSLDLLVKLGPASGDTAATAARAGLSGHGGPWQRDVRPLCPTIL